MPIIIECSLNISGGTNTLPGLIHTQPETPDPIEIQVPETVYSIISTAIFLQSLRSELFSENYNQYIAWLPICIFPSTKRKNSEGFCQSLPSKPNPDLVPISAYVPDTQANKDLLCSFTPIFNHCGWSNFAAWIKQILARNSQLIIFHVAQLLYMCLTC